MSTTTPKLTAEGKLNLRNKAKAELDRLDTIFADKKTKQKIDDFKDTFSKCEIVYKVILEDHQFHKTGSHPEIMHITMTQVPHALNYAGYTFDRDLLKRLFGSESAVGKRSVKKLRDSLTHSLNQRAIDEFISREQSLFDDMNSFLTTIRQFDSAA